MHDSPSADIPRRSVFRRLARIVGRLLLIIFLILVLVFFLIQTPWIQNIARAKAETYLSRKLKVPVRIGDLDIRLFRSVTLKNVFVGDRQKDTLLSAHLIDVQIRMWGLLHNDLDIREVHLSGLTAKIKRQLPDTAFNFQFIIDAFAGPARPEPPKKDSAQPMQMALRLLLLDSIRFVYKDTVTGNDMEVGILHSQVRIDTLDPAKGRYAVSSFFLKGLRGRVYQGQPLAAGGAGSGSATPFQLRLGTIDLQDSWLDYRNTPGALYTNLELGHLLAEVETFDLDKQVIRLKELVLDSTNTALRLGKALTVVTARKGGTAGKGGTETGGAVGAKSAAGAGGAAGTAGGGAAGAGAGGDWTFAVASVRLNGDNIQFDDDNQARQKTGMDYAHLLLRQLTLQGQGLAYTKDSISGRITRGAFTEQSGFRLQQLQTRFFYSDHRVTLQDLLLRTPGTLLQRSATLQYTSLADLMSKPAGTKVDLSLVNSQVQVKDILVFAPFLASQPAFSHPLESWRINARLTGTLDALQVQTLQVSGVRDLRLDMTGRILHPLDAKRIQTDLVVRNLSGSRTALVSLLPKGILPSNITLPEHFDLHGKLNGSLDGLQSDLVLHTSSGTILLKGFANNIRSTSGAAYDLDLQTKDLDLGAILQDSVQWGAISSEFTIKGKGLDVHTANASFSGRVSSATIRQYTYHDFSLDGSIAEGRAQLVSSINNTAVHFDLKASADLAHKFPGLQLDWQIDTLDLHALHLVKDTLQFKGHINADFADTNPDSLAGTLRITGLQMVRDSLRLTTDSIALVATRQSGNEDIQFHSEMADLDLRGHYKLTEIGQALQHTINNYYRLNGYKDTAFTSQDWTLDLHFRPSPLVLAYMPALKGTDSIGGRMSFNSEGDDLHLDLKGPRIVFGSQRFHNVNINVATGNGQLSYAVQLADGNGSGFQFYQTRLAGMLRNDQLTTDLVLKDSKGKDRYRLAGQLTKLPDGLKFILNPDSLLLNYDTWQTSRDNYIQYDSAGLIVHDFKISNKGESLSVNSNPPAATAPIDISFTDFKLSTLTRLADQDSLLIDGNLNGKAQVKNVLSNPAFTSDLIIRKLSYKTDTVGDLAIKVNNEKANAFSADISLEGNGNDLKVKGEYYTGEGKIDLQVLLNQLNLATFKNASKENIQDMRGYLKGTLALTGTMDKPLLKGSLYFDSSRIVPTLSGEPLVLSNDKIGFDEDGFNFSQFTLHDSAGNKLIIDGNVFTKDYRNYSFDMSLNANDFRLVNAPEESSRQFYGILNIDAAVNLEGKMDAPKVDGDLRVNRKTNFYFVLPGSDPEVASREGVVIFVDKDHPRQLIDSAARALKAVTTELKGMDVSINIQTDSNAIFTMVVDERTGDALTVRGRSNLVFGMDKSGKMDLTGAYEVESGSYNLSLDVLKRKFDIQHGSTITWTGDPTTAILDLTATYAANTPSIDLISNEIAGRSQLDINKFKEKLPFLVTLKMEGALLKPTITFDITLPPNILTLWPDVDAKLQQIRVETSELNKQVFALLLLNRFVGDDPLQSQAGGGTVGSMAFQSASQILTNQLDQLAASLIKGVDIHFDLNNQQDYSTGNEVDYTELNVSVSKRLFNDRIQVNVGSNFDVQGAGAPNQSASNIAGDVAVDYRLTKDGRYMVRAYRKNQYEAVVEGQVVETGVSFILTFDYNRFVELFHRNKDEKLQERKVIKPATPKTTNP